MAAPSIQFRSTGALMDGRYRRAVPRVIGAWNRGTLEFGQAYARQIARAEAYDTGEFHDSIRVRTSQRGWDVRGDLYSTDNPEKVGVIEDSYNPGGPRGHYRRRAVHVFGRTATRLSGLVRSQSRVLGAALVGAITTGRVAGFRRIS